MKAASSIQSRINFSKIDSVISFLKDSGFSKSHLEKILTRGPNVFCSRLDTTIKPKLKFFQDQGFSQSEIADLVSANPWILRISLDCRLARSFSVLKKVLGSSANVCKALSVTAWFLKHDLEKTMMPNIEFFKSCGITDSRIANYVYIYPRFFMVYPKHMKEFVERVDELGFNKESGFYFHAIRTLSSMSSDTWEKKKKLFKSLGMSEQQMLSAFRKYPQVFAVSEPKIKKITATLLARKGMDASFIVDHPKVLTFSLEGRILPRLAVYDILMRKNLLRRELKLTYLFRLSSEEFRSKFVLPYLNELGDVSVLPKSHR